MTLYRIEKNENDGCWYNGNQQFSCEDETLIKHPMPSEPNIYRGIYKSACATMEDLFWWVSKEVAVKNGYVLAKYESNDYFFREHGEICFNKLKAKRTVMTL